MGKPVANSDMPTQAKQDANVTPRMRPMSSQLVSGGAAASIALPKGALFVEIAPTTTNPAFLDWDDTASASEYDEVATLGSVRHYPIPHVSRPSTVSVFGADDVYVIVK